MDSVNFNRFGENCLMILQVNFGFLFMYMVGWSVRLSIGLSFTQCKNAPKGDLSSVTAPAYPYATDTVVFTALFV